MMAYVKNEVAMVQTASALLMVEPVAFGFNEQTAVNNYFQNKTLRLGLDIQDMARDEFDRMVGVLLSKGIQVWKVTDTPEPHTPDSIFPNNRISFHADGRVVLYPMFAPNRRNERKLDVIAFLKEHNYIISEITDYTLFENQNRFLEGTGSMVLDHVNHVAYAALSERTDYSLFRLFCSDFGYSPVCFSAFQTVGKERLPVYHTNVMMCVADRYAVICLDAIDDARERNIVADALINSGKEIVEISEAKMLRFAGNMLQVENKDGIRYLVMSQTAFDSLERSQIDKLSAFNELLPISVPVIEQYGGGSVRCMIAELFCKRND